MASLWYNYGVKILGIETSCDETAASVVEDGVSILSNVVVSQIDIFAEYGGVIPEVAARSHLEVILPVIDKALSDAGCTWDDIDAIAVTHAPGLLGSLLIGTLTARTLAILHDKPLYAVHHLKSHVYANWLEPEGVLSDMSFSGLASQPSTSYTGAPREPSLRDEPPGHVRNIRLGLSNRKMSLKKTLSATPSFPLLALVVSGGHTQILYMPGHNQFEIIGTTHDDAVGECFDKVAKILGLPYPGGPAIAKVAEGLIGTTFSSAGLENSGTSYAGKPGKSALRAASSVASGIYVPEFSNHFMLQKKQSPIKPGDPNKYRLPHPKVGGLDFSFSGLKTAVLRAVQKEVGVPISYPSHKLAELLTPQQVADFAASFQKTAVDILVEKLNMALEKYPDTQSVVVAGGVSANEELRKRASEMVFSSAGLEFLSTSYTGAPREPSLRDEPLGHVRNIRVKNSNQNFMLQKKPFSDVRVFFPAPALSGDNGAMVATACYFEIQSGVKPTDPYSLNIYPRISIEN